MNKKFKDYLAELPTFLFSNGSGEQTKLVAGTSVLAGDLAEFVKYYVDLLNLNDNISPKSMFQVLLLFIKNFISEFYE